MPSPFGSQFRRIVADVLKSVKELHAQGSYSQWVTGKTYQALDSLGYDIGLMWDVVLALATQDYIQGPESDDKDPPRFEEMWMFAVTVPDSDGKVIYIKLGFTAQRTQVTCVSFHVAEFGVRWPLRP